MGWVSSPRFIASFNQGNLLLTDETESWLFCGAAHVGIAQELARGEVAASFLHELSKIYGDDAVTAALSDFARIGFLRRRPTGDSDPEALAWWESFGGEPTEKCVSLKVLKDSGIDLLKQCLASCNIELKTGAPLNIVVTDDYLRPELETVLADDAPCLLTKIVGHTIWIGPLFRRQETVCYRCLTWWLRMHRWEHYALVSGAEGKYPLQASLGYVPATLATAAGLVAAAAAFILTHGLHPHLENAVIMIDTRTGITASRGVGAGAFCPGCLVRVRRDKEQGLQQFFTPTGGMVRRLHIRPGSPFGLKHAAAEFVYPLPADCGESILKAATSFGSGRTTGEAEENCIAEAIERYSSAFRGDEETIVATADDAGCLHPEKILLYSDRQYRDRLHLNEVSDELFAIPERLEGRLPIRWVRARSLNGEAEVKIPAGIVYFGWAFDGEPVYSVPDSIGCAAGRSRDEAIANGLFELIERDAVAIWWYNRRTVQSVRFDDFNDPAIRSVVAGFRDQGRVPYLLDITTDLGIPAYAALAPRTDGSEPLFAAAAHTYAATAALKAFKELAQIQVWSEVASAPQPFRDWLAKANTIELKYLWLQGTVDVAPATTKHLTHNEQIATCQCRLERAGIEGYWIDLTRREVDLPVVRVIAPGLRHPWARFGAGRLYDVPVSMGWRGVPPSEDDLNTNFCFL